MGILDEYQALIDQLHLDAIINEDEMAIMSEIGEMAWRYEDVSKW